MSLLRHLILRQSLLRHSILRQSLLRHLLLRQSLLRLLILRVTDSLCNSGAFNNPNAVRDCPFNLKEEAWFLSQSRMFFCMKAIVFKAFQHGPTKYFLQKKILFHVDLIKMLSLISLFLRFPSYFPQNSG